LFSCCPMRTAFHMFLWLLNLITVIAKKNYTFILLSPSNLIINIFKIISIYYFLYES
jgi:hypothetical protein